MNTTTSGWSEFWTMVGTFFSDVGRTFLTNVKTAWPALEQAGINFLVVIADAIVKAIESGSIPLPVLVAKPGATADALNLGRTKQQKAFDEIQEQLVKTPPPSGIKVTTSLINSAIEISVAKMKQMGNGGNFPGGNSGPVVE